MKALFLLFPAADPEKIEGGTPEAPPGKIAAGMGQLLSWGTWIVLAVCGIAVLVAAGRMAMAHKSGAEGGQHVVGLAWIVVAALLAGSAAALVNFVVDIDG